MEVLHTDELPLYVSLSVNIACNTASPSYLYLWKLPSKHNFLCCVSLSYWVTCFVLTLAVNQLWQRQGQLSLLTTAGVLVLDFHGFS